MKCNILCNFADEIFYGRQEYHIRDRIRRNPVRGPQDCHRSPLTPGRGCNRQRGRSSPFYRGNPWKGSRADHSGSHPGQPVVPARRGSARFRPFPPRESGRDGFRHFGSRPYRMPRHECLQPFRSP